MNSQRPTRQSLRGLRLRKHADYQRAYSAARKHQSPSMSWFLAPQSVPESRSNPAAQCASDSLAVFAPRCAANVPNLPRVGLTVGKVIGPAHERNRIKRRMREVLRLHAELLPVGFDLILHPRRSVLTIDFVKLESEVLRILSQAAAEARRASLVPLSLVPVDAPQVQSNPEV